MLPSQIELLPPGRLTVERVESATPRARPFKLSDGGDMYLLVMPDGAKYWRIRYRCGGKRKQLSLGVYPAVSIDEARRRRAELRALLADGIDPSVRRKSEREAQRATLSAASIVPRFAIDSDGGVAFHLGTRHVFLSPAETGELRAFLNATRAVPVRVIPCL